MSAVASSA